MAQEKRYETARMLLEKRIKQLIDEGRARFPGYERIMNVRESPADKKNYMDRYPERNINILEVVSPEDVEKSGDKRVIELYRRCRRYSDGITAQQQQRNYEHFERIRAAEAEALAETANVRYI